jgi:hypothetical protein
MIKFPGEESDMTCPEFKDAVHRAMAAVRDLSFEFLPSEIVAMGKHRETCRQCAAWFQEKAEAEEAKHGPMTPEVYAAAVNCRREIYARAKKDREIR